jgi:hypothetical protein
MAVKIKDSLDTADHDEDQKLKQNIIKLWYFSQDELHKKTVRRLQDIVDRQIKDKVCT